MLPSPAPQSPFARPTIAAIKSLVLATLLALPVARAEVPSLGNTPKPIQELAARIQGKKPEEILKSIIEQFGPAARNIGSGLRIEQWDVPGGLLTFHRVRGPVYENQKTKTIFHLLQTKNPVLASILGGYEVTTVADPANHGNRNWIGTLALNKNSAYAFAESGQFENFRSSQAENFFALHPKGSFEIRYPATVMAETLLEGLPEGATVATLVFTSADKAQTSTLSIKSFEQSRRLVFVAEQPIPFAIEAGWKDFGR